MLVRAVATAERIGEAERRAELLRGVEQPGGEARLVLADAGVGGCGQPAKTPPMPSDDQQAGQDVEM